jgi:hypothetical protein
VNVKSNHELLETVEEILVGQRELIILLSFCFELFDVVFDQFKHDLILVGYKEVLEAN